MFLTFYTLQAGPPSVAGPWLIYLPTLPLKGHGCINNALKKLTQCVNALKKLMLRKL